MVPAGDGSGETRMICGLITDGIRKRERQSQTTSPGAV